ncbi:Gfo/Idh/MocA family oxidoreductase [Streptomyces sp. S.PB5]|uniref:Gfo/Idh/MocA family protein n=1 Tax=Streptomyces sp. S.PB5 TaxID=3020844 RepID=UPI0025B09F38|nr:Gfo/Idh/MocA family oxidoreductase [Streptomyces sp. S.PB5]MDN3027256.1 Gfo/Idh/MocA family oxidoreductase [Streptomyces sp. S.PB5]
MKVAVLSFAHERAAAYARLLHAAPDVDLVVADPGGTRGREAARELGAAYADSWDEVFALGPAAVVVTGAPGHRRELVERAAAAGAHVLCEQPFAADAADAEAMVQACADAGVRLSLASPTCYSPAFAAVRERLSDTELLGALTTVHGAYNAPRPAGAPGGALDTNAPGLFDLVDLVLGGTPAEQVYAQTNGIRGGASDGESAALVSVRYADGTVVSVDCSWGTDGDRSVHEPALTFIGERASVEFAGAPRLLGGYDAASARERWVLREDDPYAVMLGAFLTAVREGTATGPDGATGVRTLRIIEAARESARTGQPVGPAAPHAVAS